MGTGPRNFSFGRLTKPPVPGKAGFSKLVAGLMGVIEIAPEETGLHLAKMTEKFNVDSPDVNIRPLANPNTEIAMYISCTGRHSVVHFRDEFWAVMSSIRKYEQIPRTRTTPEGRIIKHKVNGKLNHIKMHLLKPGAHYSRKGELGTWEGLPEASVKYLTEFMQRFWDAH
jgi:hypothetical protein